MHAWVSEYQEAGDGRFGWGRGKRLTENKGKEVQEDAGGWALFGWPATITTTTTTSSSSSERKHTPKHKSNNPSYSPHTTKALKDKVSTLVPAAP